METQFLQFVLHFFMLVFCSAGGQYLQKNMKNFRQPEESAGNQSNH